MTMGYWTQEGGSTSPTYVSTPTVEPAKPQRRYSDAGTPCGNGLVAHVMNDQSNRPITEYSLEPGASKRSAWMGRFMDQPQLQVKIHKDKFNDTAARSHAKAEFDSYNALVRRMAGGR
jgi:hypothetical protein